jgi:release factor glutamine methyltransferase
VRTGTPVRDALDGAMTAIGAAGCETPRLDAEVLLAHVLGVSRERLWTDHELVVAGSAVRAFQDAVRRRAVEREPVAYIVGQRAFRHLDVAVDPRVLVPRPETELLVEVGLRLPQGARVLDVGTGSGAVALALKQERPDLHVSASDVSSDALDLARANGERLGLQVHWLQGDLLDALACTALGAAANEIASVPDAVLCNPPYVAESDRACLPPEILRHEPPGALFAGPDGLATIRRLVRELGEHPGVRLAALEVGAGQAFAVGELMRDTGFTRVRAERDLAGIERVVVGEQLGEGQSVDREGSL